MPEITEHPAGTFCWVDLATPDAAKAKEFYAGLFGWSYQDNEAGEGMIYSVIRTPEGKQVGGLAQQAEAPPYWNPYVCTADADATASKVKEAGGTLLMETIDVMGTLGRMFIAADPQGAVFSVWQPRDHHGAEVVYENGAMTWWEVYTREPDASEAFYSKVFGWEAVKSDHVPDHPYYMLRKDGKDVGGMLPMQGPQWDNVPPHWMVYFGVEDVDAAFAKAKELGGSNVTECMDIPGNIGRFAILQDPLGAVFTIFKPVPNPSQ